MRILVCTQIVDRKDPSLGFFTRWIEELASRTEQITVVCLKEGEYTLPNNVRVLSLGKERGTPPLRKLVYAARFYSALWKARGQYDAVLVHMNQEYVLLGGWLWRLWGKRVYMWRNHYAGSALTGVASLFCDKVFYTSKFSYTARYKKALQMPVGVDVESVRMDVPVERKARSVLFLARLEESKRPDILLRALGLLRGRGVDFRATIVGGPTDPASVYPECLKALAKELNIDSLVSFTGAVPNTETFRQYRSHEIFVNCSLSGMLDKTMFKAVASGCLVLTASSDFGELAGEEYIYRYGDAQDLSKKLEQFLSFDPATRQGNLKRLERVIKANTLSALAERLVNEMFSLSAKKETLTNAYAREYYDAQVGALSSYEAQRWHSSVVRRFEYRQTERALKAALAGRHYQNALEIGPGDGVWTTMVRGFVSGKLHLVEQSQEMLERAKAKLADASGVMFERADFMESNSPGGNDLIVAVRCFEYFQDKEAALKKMRALLSPGGRIVIITKNPSMLTSVPAQDKTLHQDQVSRAHMRELSRAAGLRLVAVYPAIVRWKASWALMRAFFDLLHRVAVASKGILVVPFINTYAVESYAYILSDAS